MSDHQDYDLSDNPFENFSAWLLEAEKKGIEHFNAFTLATADKQGQPDARTVLYKGLRSDELFFFTSYEGVKAKHIAENPYVSGVFYWHETLKQIRFKGKAKKLGQEHNQAYFSSRRKDSQLAAMASAQSAPIENRAKLMEKFNDLKKQFATSDPTLPAEWGGYSIEVHEMEFFLHDTESRLNDRFVFRRNEQNDWTTERLQP